MKPEKDFKAYTAAQQKRINEALRGFLPRASCRPRTLHESMRYSVFAGGKRLRPILCLAAAEACGSSDNRAMPAACAVECVHTYSLIHDDLPCMDDDDLRRGKPTNHKVYGEAVAVLAGDALLALAFELISQSKPAGKHTAGKMAQELALTAGSKHLVGGQVMDMEGEGAGLSARQLRFIHESKTAALLTCSLRLGAMAAGASQGKMDSLSQFGKSTGLAFQIIDDILDITQSSEKLGKSAGKDLATEKATYPAVHGLEKSRREAARLTADAIAALKPLGSKASRLREIAGYLLDREY
ncbi:MAG: polyprenyl synthetase family protein [Verrucomicrobiales bacterium]|nr:polyprenyl synthetase family protein [Verrucomicrobiales bacterium]MED5587156.1 farnesyl diphosphate synthase [Verrucomicrobiota bacterium]